MELPFNRELLRCFRIQLLTKFGLYRPAVGRQSPFGKRRRKSGRINITIKISKSLTILHLRSLIHQKRKSQPNGQSQDQLLLIISGQSRLKKKFQSKIHSTNFQIIRKESISIKIQELVEEILYNQSSSIMSGRDHKKHTIGKCKK